MKIELKTVSQIMAAYKIEDYFGKYVAMESQHSNKIVSADKSLVKTYKQAQKKGIKNPAMLYVPGKNEVYI